MSLATLAGPLMTIMGSGSLVFITIGRGVISRAKEEIMEVEELLEPSPTQVNETE